MNTHQLKEEIVDFINHADERFIRLVYSMVESERSEAGFFNGTNNEMIERAKKSLKSVNEGMVRDISEFKKDIANWKTNRPIK